VESGGLFKEQKKFLEEVTGIYGKNLAFNSLGGESEGSKEGGRGQHRLSASYETEKIRGQKFGDAKTGGNTEATMKSVSRGGKPHVFPSGYEGRGKGREGRIKAKSYP